MTAPVTEPTPTGQTSDYVVHLPGGRVTRVKATGFLDVRAQLAPVVADFVHPAAAPCPKVVTR